ncbi:glycosyl transferase, partial [Acinetobacter baumannii]|nr:glycosyl transferase [Acinetobacter baumannii]
IKHSLSRTEKETNAWRDKERLYDLVLTLKYYYSYAELRILKLFFKKILGGKIKDALLILSTAFNGAHPRCMNKVLND